MDSLVINSIFNFNYYWKLLFYQTILVTTGNTEDAKYINFYLQYYCILYFVLVVKYPQ